MYLYTCVFPSFQVWQHSLAFGQRAVEVRGARHEPLYLRLSFLSGMAVYMNMNEEYMNEVYMPVALQSMQSPLLRPSPCHTIL